MLAFILSLITTYMLFLFLPLWLVWPLGVLFSLYMVIIRKRVRGFIISDAEILAVLVGVWLICVYGMLIFLQG